MTVGLIMVDLSSLAAAKRTLERFGDSATELSWFFADNSEEGAQQTANRFQSANLCCSFRLNQSD